MMTPELETYFNNYADLFSTDGWNQLIEDMRRDAALINVVEFTKDAEDLYTRKGQLTVMASILNLENTIKLSREQAEELEAESE